MAITRQRIINRAKQLIISNPIWGKDKINVQLRREFGVGLRRIEVAKLKKLVTKQSPILSQQQIYLKQRQVTLQREGFLPQEAQYYSHYPISKPGLKSIRRFRASEIRNAIKKGVSRARIISYISDSYETKGYLDKGGKINPQAWYSRAFDEITKPIKERKSVLIEPEAYNDYRKAKQQFKFSIHDSLALSEAISSDKLPERMEQYRILRNAFFSHWEAFSIITAQTPSDKEGKIELQNLDLRNDYWQNAIQERINDARESIRKFMARGMNYPQAKQAYTREVELYYQNTKQTGDGRFQRGKETPWGWLREYYKWKAKPTVDFVEGKGKRQQRMDKKKMPYRVSRVN